MVPPRRSEGAAEGVGEADGVGGALLLEDGDAGEAEGVAREAGHHVALEGVDEAHAKHAVAEGGDRGVGARRRHHGDAVALADAPAREGERAGDLAEDAHGAFDVDQPGDGAGGLGAVAAGVLDGDVEGLAEQAAGGVDLLGGEGDAVAGGCAEVGHGAGEGGVEAEGDGVAVLATAAREGGRGEGSGGAGEEGSTCGRRGPVRHGDATGCIRELSARAARRSGSRGLPGG